MLLTCDCLHRHRSFFRLRMLPNDRNATMPDNETAERMSPNHNPNVIFP